MKNLQKEVSEVVFKAGNYLLSAMGTVSESQIEDKSLNNLVSHVDKEAERILVDGLSKIVPEALFLTEEKTTDNTPNEKALQWIIDPLDGTTNFLFSLPVFAVSIALVENGEPILGAVLDVCRNECYYAEAGKGAFCNDTRIYCSNRKTLSESLLATGFPYYEFENIDQYLKSLHTFMKSTRGLRRMGSAAIDLAYTARGLYDGFFEYNLSPWDVAGGTILVREAGGIVTEFNGGNNPIFGKTILAANPYIYEFMRREL
jgi:myo-inositol-1(or 4)-monophosphatase